MTSSSETSLSPDINKMSLYTVIGGGPNNGANKHAPPPCTQHQCNTRYKVNHPVTNYTDTTHVRLPDNKPQPPPPPCGKF